MRFVRTGCDWSMSRNLNIWNVLEESGTDEAEYHKKVARGRRVGGSIRSLINARGLQFGCVEGED